MYVISGTQEALPQGCYGKLATYRHKVFVERLGWQLDTPPGIEQDQFDRPDTLYVIAHEEDGRITGCARLLPTNQPYLLGEIFPTLLNGLEPPCTTEVWELSRFAAVDFDAQHTSPLGQFSSPIAVGLLREAIACAGAQGARQLITVSPLGVERLLHRAGFSARRAGPPVIDESGPIIACLIDIPESARQVDARHRPPLAS